MHQHGIQIVANNFTIERVRLEETLENPVERNIVIARNHQHRYWRHAIEKRPGFFKLLTLGALGEVAAYHDGVRVKVRDSSHQGFRHFGHKRRSKMKIRDM